ncbi:Fe3+-citrate ABC transporter substrate-binding protein [Gordonia crocea]|uniref:Fe3+-citrate ABC transporter substrate-binding protein n=2 Tax=Gordonia crocea TaxID=589162 RepID=A0A7I9UZP8_9ACTN|nr:ABC transporter substrate-binding protein [Gordonia crocea]GED98341.1 Fe3+-citrate ABC transporter substrate-binding protein [Gordonia crocea]
MHRIVRHTGAALLAAVTGMAVLSACGSDDGVLRDPQGNPISTSTTRIAEVNLVNPDRDYAKTCAAPTAADTRRVDARRIVVTDPGLLDAVCALGLGPKIVAVTAAPGAVPAYLGPQLAQVPAVGAAPAADAVAKADADLVLTTPSTSRSAAAFGGVRSATIEPGGWEDVFRAVAAALGRPMTADRLLTQFRTDAQALGKRMDAAHSQVSLVRFGPGSETIAGTESFAGQILGIVGVQRPERQRSAGPTPITDENFTAADGDLIYVSFEPDGLEHGKSVLLSDRWLDMGAPTWKRVLGVDDAVWYRTSGLAAARLVLADLKKSLDGNSSQY